jgi:transcriptional regulator with XRE-family HTH domain
MQSANGIDVALGLRLTALRQQHGLTASILAPFAGMSEAELEAAERGLRRLSVAEIFRLCQTLNIRPFDLYRAPGYEGLPARSFLADRGPDKNRPQTASPLA